MTGNPQSPFGRPTSRKSFKPEVNLLETRDLLAGASGLLAGAELFQRAPLGNEAVDRHLPPILPQGFRAGLTLSTHFLEVTRGGPAATYTVALAAKPTADVTVTITQDTHPVHILLADRHPAGDVPPPLDVSPTTLTFTPDNWDKPQTVTVSAPAPGTASRDRGVLLLHKMSSEDSSYGDFFALPVGVLIRDHPPAEPAGLVLSDARIEVTRGGAAATYTVALATQPTADVTVSLSQVERMRPQGLGLLWPVNDIQLTIEPATLTFTSENWNEPQTVKVSVAAKDVEVMASLWAPPGRVPGFALVDHQIASADPTYDGLQVAPVHVVVHETPPAPRPGVRLSTHQLQLNADNQLTDTFTLALATRPTAPVTFTITQAHTFRQLPGHNRDATDGPRQVTLTVAPQTFTLAPEDWDKPVTITVSAPADLAGRPLAFPLLTFTVQSDDADYKDLWVAPVGVSIPPSHPRPIEVTPPIPFVPPPPPPPQPPIAPPESARPGARAALRKHTGAAARIAAALRAARRRRKRQQP